MYELVESLTPERLRALSLRTFREMRRAGITAVGEFHYVHHVDPSAADFSLDDAIVEAARESGIRLALLQSYYRTGGPGRPLEGGQRRFDGVSLERFIAHCETLARRGDFDLFLLAGRYTLLEQAALDTFLPLCTERGIGIVLGGPYNSGILARGPSDDAQYNYSNAPKDVIDRVRRINAVCERHGVKMIEAALNFPLRHPAVVSVIPGGQSVAEVRSNRDILGKDIPAALWADLKSEGLMRADAPV